MFVGRWSVGPLSWSPPAVRVIAKLLWSPLPTTGFDNWLSSCYNGINGSTGAPVECINFTNHNIPSDFFVRDGVGGLRCRDGLRRRRRWPGRGGIRGFIGVATVDSYYNCLRVFFVKFSDLRWNVKPLYVGRKRKNKCSLWADGLLNQFSLQRTSLFKDE